MHPKVTTRIVGDKIFFGPGIATLLEHIKTSGSIKKAAKDMGISYTKAFRILNEADVQLNFPVLERFHGGNAGGKAVLTPEGEDYLERYLAFNKAVQEYAKTQFREIFQQDCPHQ